MDILETLKTLWNESGFQSFFVDGGWKNLLMILISCVLLYLGIKKKFEPLLLVGIAFGCLLVNLSYFGAGSTDALYHLDLWDNFLDPSHPDYHSYGAIMREGGLLDILYIGVKAGIYPSLIFMGVGAMTDFGPLISNPKSLLLGAAAQMGVFLAFFGAVCLGFTGQEAASIGIIGGADGPTAIFLTTKLAPHLLGPIAIAAYSYMALIPMIQPPLMRLLTTEKERKVKMEQSRQVSKTEKIIFPIIVGNSSSAVNSSSCRMPYAWKSLERVRSYRKTFRYSSECSYEHRNSIPRNLSWSNNCCKPFPFTGNYQDRFPWSYSILFLHYRRTSCRKAHV